MAKPKPKQRIYRHPTQKDVDVPQYDLLTFLFDSEHSASLPDSVLHREAAAPNNSITKAALKDLSQQIAHSLRTHYAIGAGGPDKDVVTVISYGQILVPAVLYGVIAAGGVYSAASPSSTAAELTRQVQIAGSRLIVCGSEHVDVARAAAVEAGLGERGVLVLESGKGAWGLQSLDGSVDCLGSEGEKLEWENITDPKRLRESLIVILWSSGTTGLPKGVMLSHLNLVAETYITALSGRAWAAREMEKGTFVAKQHMTLAHLPISHIAGLFGYMIGPVYNGATVVWMRRYEWGALLKYLKQYPITSWYTVPSIWLRISKSAEITDHLKHLEGVSTGAAPMDGELMRGVNRKVGDGRQTLIGQTWGLSETTGAVTMMPKEETDDTGSISPILPGVELRMVDEEFNDVDPETQEGELLVRSVLVTNGYFNNPKATEESFHDGWFCSGDIGSIKDGKFYVVDRKKELLKYKGLQVAPAEIENLLFHHPNIKEACVIGLPAPNDPGTDLPRAYVVANDRSTISEEEVKKYVADRLAPYKQLRGGVAFVDEIPKNAIGKMLRRELRDGAKKKVGGSTPKL